MFDDEEEKEEVPSSLSSACGMENICDSDYLVDMVADEIVSSAISAARTIVGHDNTPGPSKLTTRTTIEEEQVAVPPGPDLDIEESLPLKGQHSKLGMSISTVPLQIDRPESSNAAATEQVNLLAIEIVGTSLQKCFTEKKDPIEGLTGRNECEVQIYDEDTLSRQASRMVDSAIESAKAKEETKAKLGDSIHSARPEPTSRPPSRPAQLFEAPLGNKAPSYDDESGVMANPASSLAKCEIKNNLTLKESVDRLDDQLDDDEVTLKDKSFLSFSGRTGEKLDRTPYPSSTAGPLYMPQRIPEPLSRNDGPQLVDGQMRRPILPSPNAQQQLRPQTTLTPEVRAHVEARLLSIRSKLSDVTQTLKRSGVMPSGADETPTSQSPPKEP